MFESKYIKQLISNGLSETYEYDAVSRFTGDLRAINDDNEFLTSFKNIYPEELDLKVERQGNHVSFLDLDIKTEDCFQRDKFPLFIVRMPHLSSNIPSTISSGSIFLELLRITRCSLKTKNFIPRASDLLSRMIVQDGNLFICLFVIYLLLGFFLIVFFCLIIVVFFYCCFYLLLLFFVIYLFIICYLFILSY